MEGAIEVSAHPIAAGGARVAAQSAAAEFPDRPVRIAVPFAAGGATHTLARLFSEQLEKTVGGTVVVTAVDGAGGAIGAAQVARAKPDGYTLLMGSNGTNGQRWMVSEAGYTLDSFVSLGSIAALPEGFAARTDSPIRSMKELVESLKKNPNTKYASVGTGSSLHISAERFASMAGLNIQHIGSRGGRDAIVKLLSGEVAFIVVAAHNFPAQMKDGKEGELRGLAVTSAQPFPYAKELPTMKSLGYDFVSVTWWGPFAPKGLPKEPFDKLSVAIEKAAQSPAMLEVFQKFYFMPCYQTPAQAAADLRQFSQQSEAVLKKIGLHKDLPKSN